MLIKSPHLIIFLIISSLQFTHAQTVSVDDQNYDALSLSQLLLEGGCIEIENASISSPDAVAYFTNNGGNFPLQEGVIIRSGEAFFSGGAYTGDNLSTQLNSTADPYLQENTISDVKESAFLEFEFTPLSENFNFNFVFASNEYGQYQCVGSDTFVFVLTNLNTGQQTNIAIVPNSSGNHIAVQNIRDSQFNSSCSSQNANSFSTYNVDDPGSSTINMRGFTQVLNASSNVQPGTPYRARLVVGDTKDSQFDSAVFIEAGSFDTDFDLGPDRNLCEGSAVEINTHLDPQVYDHEWSLNGNVLTNETDSILEVTQPGEYSIEIVKENSDCVLTDEIMVAPLSLENPRDLKVCNTGADSYEYNLLSRNSADLGLAGNYQVVYYTSYSNAQNNTPIPSGNLSNYNSSPGATIYVRVRDQGSGILCGSIAQFDLIEDEPIEANDSPLIRQCLDNIDDQANIDLTQNNGTILGNNDAQNYNVIFYDTEEDAINGDNSIEDPTNFSFTGNNRTAQIWVRVESKEIGNCFETTSFIVEKNERPEVSELSDTLVCSGYVLPPIQFGSYYDAPGGPNGTGNQLDQGEIVDETGNYYIFNGPDENNCTNQSSFIVYVIEDFELDTERCGSYTLPNPIQGLGTYYTEPDGPNGSGTELPPGTEITSDQTIYYYAEYEGALCVDKAFDITIIPAPEIDQPENVVSCQTYTLPQLNNGSYFTEPGGNGEMLAGGTVINESQTLYVFADDGTCSNQAEFDIAIPLNYTDVTVCDSFPLPDLFGGGGYYTEPGGQGEQIPDTDTITESQTIYFYIGNQNLDCAENTEFDVTVNPSPLVDELEDQTFCADQSYTLPELTNGNYFTGSNGNGEQLSAGDEITESRQIFIYNSRENCSSQTSFNIEFIPLPDIPILTNVFDCSFYILPQISNGSYYTEPGATGEQLQAGDTIYENQEIFVYAESEELISCYSEESFIIRIRNAEVGEFDDVRNCGPYTLPQIEFGNYYTEPGGTGDQLAAGDIIENDQTIYVYNTDGERFPCTDEDTIQINISVQPELQRFEDVNVCGEYFLPQNSLPTNPEVTSGFYRERGGNDRITENSLSPGVYKIYVYAVSNENEACFDQDSLNVRVFPRPEIEIDDGAFCTDLETGEVISPYRVETGIDQSEFEVNWYKDDEQVHSGANFEISEAGTYTVRTVKLNSEGPNDCNYAPATINVTRSSQPVFTVNKSRDFADQTFITVNVTQGNGPYEYRLDDGTYTTNNRFTGLESGTHTVSVRSVRGDCGATTQEVDILNYPKFFTPNQDGINDTWTIEDLDVYSDVQIYIFNRYGKLLTVITPDDEPWNGNYKGRQMPSDEYWFKVTYDKEGIQNVFKSHFTLKR